MKNNLKKYFTNFDLLDQALTHRSWVNEHKGIRPTNERLEFLGDAVLEFVVSNYLYLKYYDKEEGFLTALRSNLVNTTNLSEISKRLSVGEMIFLSKGEEEGGGRENSSLLADTLEAIIGAIFLDSGIKKAEKFISQYLLSRLDEIIKKPLKDAKSRLQEIIQAKSYMAPKYIVIKENGPDHAKEFVIEVVVNQRSIAKGMGKSKAESEQKAAENALEILADKDFYL